MSTSPAAVARLIPRARATVRNLQSCSRRSAIWSGAAQSRIPNMPMPGAFHTSATASQAAPTNPSPRENPNNDMPPREMNVGRTQFADFSLKGKTYVVTGGARGLGLALAEALCEAGGRVYCLDVFEKPDDAFHEAERRVVPEWGGSLQYRQQDVSDTDTLNETMASIADENQGLDGLLAAAAIQQITPAIDYKAEDMTKMMNVNYNGAFLAAQAAARQMFRFNRGGSIVFIASVSGSIANRGLLAPVYNSSKAAVVQLSRNLAMEWSPRRGDGSGGIRVNCISPGNIITPMVEKNFEEVPGLKEEWESYNMMGRLAQTHEFKGAALFLLSNASSFMTGSNLVMDGGLSAW